jgi:hypothetical protein
VKKHVSDWASKLLLALYTASVIQGIERHQIGSFCIPCPEATWSLLVGDDEETRESSDSRPLEDSPASELACLNAKSLTLENRVRFSFSDV